MKPEEIEWHDRFYIRCRQLPATEEGRTLIWEVGEKIGTTLHPSADAGPASYEEALDWIKRQRKDR